MGPDIIYTKSNQIDRLWIRFIFLFVFSFISSIVYAQQTIQSDILGAYDSATSTWVVSTPSQSDFKKSGVKPSTAKLIFETIEKYQDAHKEKLGIAVGIDTNRQLTIKSRNDLPPHAIAINPGDMAILIDDLEGRSARDSLATALLEELEDTLGGTGVHKKKASASPIGNGNEFQTLDPIETGVDEQDLENISKVTCSMPGIHCSKHSVSIDGAALTESLKVKPYHMPDFLSCKAAREKFRRIIEVNEGNQNIHEWRNLVGAEAAAKAFDDACLDSSDKIDTDILRNFAVLKMPDNLDPFCGAYRIGKKQFLTAMHCFLKPNGGVDKEKLQKAQLFLYNSPTDAISLSPDALPEIEDRRRYRGIKKEIPARRDFILLTTKIFDKANSKELTLNIGGGKIGNPVYIPGFFYYYEKQATSAADWTKSIRMTKSLGENYCRIIDASLEASYGGCLIHRCQVINGFSGSPVLQRGKSGQLSLVGVHVHGASGFNYHCASPFAMAQAAGRTDTATPVIEVSNIAALITEKLLLEVGWERNNANEK